MTNMEKITESFSLAKGGRVVENAVAELTPDTDYVFIALGGAGMETLSLIKTGIVRGCRVPRTSSDHYLAIDTDPILMEKYTFPDSGYVPFEDREHVLLRVNMTEHALMEAFRRPQVLKWLNPSLRFLLDPYGAQGIRQVGRFHLSWIYNFSALRRALQGISAALSPGRTHRIYLLSSLGGGTGSGAFIDLAYLIRDVFAIHNHIPSASLHGFLFFPDVMDFRDTPIRRQHNYANGFAALKELDFYMTLEGRAGGNDGLPEEYSFTYQDGSTVTSREDIFEQCTLISGADRAEMTYVSAVGAASEGILRSVIEARDNTGTSLSDFLDNAVTADPVTVTAPYRNLYPVEGHYQYMALGIGETRVPVQECCACALHQIFGTISQQFEAEKARFHDLHGHDAAGLLDACGLGNMSEMEKRLTEGAAFSSSNAGPQYNKLRDFQSDDPDLFRWEWERFEDGLAHVIVETNCPQTAAHFIERLSAGLDRLLAMNPLRAFLTLEVTDASRSLHPDCLIGRLEGMAKRLSEELHDASVLLQKAEEQYATAMKGYGCAGILTRSITRRALFEAAEALAKVRYEKSLKEAMVRTIDEIIRKLMESYGMTCLASQKMLEVFARGMKENMDELARPDYLRYHPSSFFRYDPAAPLYAPEHNLAATVRHDRLMAHMENVVGAMDVNAFLREFVSVIGQNRDEWLAFLKCDEIGVIENRLPEETPDLLAEKVRRLFTDQLPVFSGMSLRDYLVIVYKHDGMSDQQALNAAVADLCHNLSDRAEPLFRTGEPYSLRDQLAPCSLTAFCVPENQPALLNAFAGALGPVMPGNGSLFGSSDPQAVSVIRIYQGLPVFILREIDEMKAAYQNALEQGECGLHSDENPESGFSWLAYSLLTNP